MDGGDTYPHDCHREVWGRPCLGNPDYMASRTSSHGNDLPQKNDTTSPFSKHVLRVTLSSRLTFLSRKPCITPDGLLACH